MYTGYRLQHGHVGLSARLILWRCCCRGMCPVRSCVRMERSLRGRDLESNPLPDAHRRSREKMRLPFCLYTWSQPRSTLILIIILSPTKWPSTTLSRVLIFRRNSTDSTLFTFAMKMICTDIIYGRRYIFILPSRRDYGFPRKRAQELPHAPPNTNNSATFRCSINTAVGISDTTNAEPDNPSQLHLFENPLYSDFILGIPQH